MEEEQRHVWLGEKEGNNRDKESARRSTLKVMPVRYAAPRLVQRRTVPPR
jgi:hypothetical protein